MLFKKIGAVFLIFPLMLCGCGEKDENENKYYQIASELMDVLWNVDYHTFTSKRTTEFATRYYEDGYLEYYLEDTEYNAGVEYTQNTKIISRLLSTKDLSFAEQELDGAAYLVQKLEAEVAIDHFSPLDPENTYYEEGKEYTLIYNIYFTEQEGDYKIAGFSYQFEEGEILPDSEREELTEGERQQIINSAREYINVRYFINYADMDEEAIYKAYEENLTGSFLEWEGITPEWVATLAEEYRAYHVSVTVVSSVLEGSTKKTAVYDGVSQHYYYYVDALYEYALQADSIYLSANDLAEKGTVNERIYFEKGEDGCLRIAFAKYANE